MSDDSPRDQLPSWTDGYVTLPWAAVGPELGTLLEATINKLDREWPTSLSHAPHGKLLLRQFVTVTRDTYEAILFLSADDRDSGRKLEHALATTPLVRTILDTLCNVLLLLDDLPVRADQYWKAGWREMAEQYLRLQVRYGADPDWSEWLVDFKDYIDRGVTAGIVTTEEVTATLNKVNPGRPAKWPTPGMMKQVSSFSEDRRDFIMFLDDWFYKELSQDSHLSLPGLIRRSVLAGDDSKPRIAMMEKHRSDGVFTTVSIVLALISEIISEFRFELTDRALYLWHVLNPVCGDAKELYDRRYSALLRVASNK
jgi:hypothetical protein